jgi:hypothetical protein
LRLNNKLTLYATKTTTDQLRALHGVSITRLEAVLGEDGVLEVTATAVLPDGRTDQDTGAVSVQGLRGEALCNARMKARTKAKRRVTLSICGLGWLDESEVDSIPDARRVAVDTTTGEITAHAEPPVVVHPAQRPRSRAVPEGKRWSEADLAYFWGNLAALEPKVTSDELHAILAVDSLHAWPGDLDAALALVREARAARLFGGEGASRPLTADEDAALERERILAKLDDDAPENEDEESLGSVLDHPDGSIEREWQRYNAVAKLALAWNKDYPEQSVKWNAPERDGTAAHVRGTAEGLERRLSKLLGTRRSAP